MMRIDQYRHAVDQVEAASDNQAHARRLRGLPGANDARQRIPVNDTERLDPEFGSRGEQFVCT